MHEAKEKFEGMSNLEEINKQFFSYDHKVRQYIIVRAILVILDKNDSKILDAILMTQKVSDKNKMAYDIN